MSITFSVFFTDAQTEVNSENSVELEFEEIQKLSNLLVLRGRYKAKEGATMARAQDDLQRIQSVIPGVASGTIAGIIEESVTMIFEINE